MVCFARPLIVPLRLGPRRVGLPIENADEAMLMLHSGRLLAYRFDGLGRERPAWTAAYTALTAALNDPDPETLAEARAALYRVSMFANNHDWR